jgi:hypothetical protein
MKGILLLVPMLLFSPAAYAQQKKPPPGVPSAPQPNAPPRSDVQNLPPTPRASGPPTNCNTAGGYPCTKSNWNVPSCTTTPTYGGSNGSQDSGPCLAGVLRCKGSTNTCTTGSLPSQTGSPPQILQGNTSWIALVGNFPQTTYTSDSFYDNNALQYSNIYTYVVTVMYSGSGGGVWSSYSAPFQVSFGQAPTAPAGTPATPLSLVVVTQ